MMSSIKSAQIFLKRIHRLLSGPAPHSAILIPGVRSSYENGWRQLWKYFLGIFLICLVEFLIGLPAESAQMGGMFVVFGIVYGFLVTGPISYGMAFVYLKASRGDKPEIRDAFAAFNTYWNAVLSGLLVLVICALGFILLIIPGIIFSCKLAFTPYLVVDRKMEVIEAIKESWHMTGGHAWKVFFIFLLAIPISIAGLICLGVGVIISTMWVSLAFASLYHAISMSRQHVQLGEGVSNRLPPAQ